MSWSFNAVGRPSLVLAQARTQFAAIKCAEPEETIKTKALHILEASLLAMPEASAVQIEAHGSQSVSSDGKASNQLLFKITPLHGFVDYPRMTSPARG